MLGHAQRSGLADVNRRRDSSVQRELQPLLDHTTHPSLGRPGETVPKTQAAGSMNREVGEVVSHGHPGPEHRQDGGNPACVRCPATNDQHDYQQREGLERQLRRPDALVVAGEDVEELVDVKGMVSGRAQKGAEAM